MYYNIFNDISQSEKIMHKSQIEIYLCKLYDSLMSVKSFIMDYEFDKIDDCVADIKETMKIIESDKAFLSDENITLLDVMLGKIQELALENLKKLKEKKSPLYRKFRRIIVNSKILNKYSSIIESGTILDKRWE